MNTRTPDHTSENKTESIDSEGKRTLLSAQKDNLDEILNLYWGGTERRISNLTVKIIGVNAVALIILALGIIYLGQYRSNLIENRLIAFKSEVELLSTALSSDATHTNFSLNQTKTKLATVKLGQTLNKHVRVFDTNGQLIADSHPNSEPVQAFQDTRTLKSVQTLKNMANFVLRLLPQDQALPPYPKQTTQDGRSYPDVYESLNGSVSLSAWENHVRGDKKLTLSAAAPIFDRLQRINNTITGSVLLIDHGQDIEATIAKVWGDVLRIFIGTLIVTIILSIYLSGSIASPLRRLSRAAEAVRVGKNRETVIPDFSERNDEIGELSIVLRKMTDTLWERMDSIESFAADVAHELKNPLTSLKSAVETAEIVKKPEDREKLLGVIKHDIQRLDRLITDISSASRLDAELSREAFSKLDVMLLLKDLVDLYKDPLEREANIGNFETYKAVFKDITITLSNGASKSMPPIWGLEGRLIQVFQNLISNAISFSKSGDHIKISITETPDFIQISVADEGIGIPENKVKNIFERFYSERPDHEDYGNHSGLGLSICKQIIDAHGGMIYAENKGAQDKDEQAQKSANSEHATGAVFHVILPILRPQD
jgi:two-component system sensor histidine kinase ChvG